MLVGTILCALVAVVIAVPISVFSALFLNFYAPQWMKKILVAVIDMMAAFPSILFGIWGFLVLMPSVEYWGKLINKYLGWIPIFQVEPYFFTRSPFVAGVVLAIMIIPIITSVSREIFAQAPLDRIQAAFALGATRWTMIKAVVIPHGRSGVVGGAMLGLGRAIAAGNESFSLGRTSGIWGVSRETIKKSVRDPLVRALLQIFWDTMREMAGDFGYSTCHVNRNFNGVPHRDKNNVGLSWALSLGDFSGGELVCETEDPRALACHNTKRRPVIFDGARPHWVTPYEGKRYSVILYTSKDGPGDLESD